MDTQKVEVKIFTTDGSHPALSEFVPVFHSWIQQHRVPGELLIDVANYAHVPDGPGVMLIGHEGNYSLDLTSGEPGLLYSQRRPAAELDFSQALTRAVRHALLACSLLEGEDAFSQPLRFRTDRWLVRINDRLHAPNEPSTWERVQAASRAALSSVLGEQITLQPVAPGRELFGFHVKHPTQRRVSDLLAGAS